MPRLPEPVMVNRLNPNRGMLHSRQASNNSNQHSSLDDSGVVDDHDGEDVTSAEEHERREYRDHKAEKSERMLIDKRNLDLPRVEQPHVPLTYSVRSNNREIKILKYNDSKMKYRSHIVVLGK